MENKNTYVETVELLDDQVANASVSSEFPPIMRLLSNLIRKKQSMVMTNSQILEILQKEFDINIENRHELEIDIFIKIVKKYLKDWPQWEELERISSRLNKLKDYAAIDKVLKHKYKNLKEYLRVRLDIAKESATTLKDVNNEIKESTENESNDVVMEVYCSRDQLNHLFYRIPKYDLFSQLPTIFNTSDVVPNRIQCNSLSLKTVLNLWSFKIIIILPWFAYNREIYLDLEHKLVNKTRKSPERINNTILPKWQMQGTNKFKPISKSELIKEMEHLINIHKTSEKSELVEIVFKVLIDDIEDGPEDFCVTQNYRKFCSKYTYERYLYYDNDESSDKFDIQLHETMTPTKVICINRFKSHRMNCPPIEEWFKILCTVCKMDFYTTLDVDRIINHYNDHHVNNSPEWQCSKCKRKFDAAYLGEKIWCHNC